MRELELMGTLGCHLCEVAEALIVANVDMQKYAVYQVDIAEEDELMDKYAVRIPVLVDLNSGAELDWPFGQPELESFLNQLV